MWDLVGHSEDRISHNEAQMSMYGKGVPVFHLGVSVVLSLSFLSISCMQTLKTLINDPNNESHFTRNPVFGVSDQV